MRKFILFLILVLVAGYFLIKAGYINAPFLEPYIGKYIETNEKPDDANKYISQKYGFEFAYPTGYVLSERNNIAPGISSYMVMLVKEQDNFPRENSEGPTSVNVEIYENVKNSAVIDWIKNNAQLSNFNLSSGAVASTTVGGVPGIKALTYSHTGLYEADVTAFALGNNIILVRVTYLTPTDINRATYRAILRSFKRI